MFTGVLLVSVPAVLLVGRRSGSFALVLGVPGQPPAVFRSAELVLRLDVEPLQLTSAWA